MFLRVTNRKKDSEEHRYWSIFDNRRLPGGRVRQRHVALGRKLARVCIALLKNGTGVNPEIRKMA